MPSKLEDFIFTDDGKYVKLIQSLSDAFDFVHKINELHLLPPILNSFKIICLAFNYSDQDQWLRFGKDPPKDPVISLKPKTSLTGPFENVICPSFVHQLDYEGELAFVIGKKCKNVQKYHTLENVAGYFVMNDISSRQIQFIDRQYARAKGFDTFGPCGPWLTTPDEISNPNDLHITTKVNGEIRQDSSTKNLILDIETIIENLSKIMTLEPGDIISTGTPSGTGLSLSNVRSDTYLNNGDVVEVEIQQLGKIKNKILMKE